ncbi:MAG: PIG-L deacetylase family protein [Bacillota bacterium]
MAVTAHPDDLEAVAGGPLRLTALAGSEIEVVVLSDGRQQQITRRSNLGEIRGLEESHAANILGYHKVHQLGFRDLSLSRIGEIEPRLREIWDALRPEVVFAFPLVFPNLT